MDYASLPLLAFVARIKNLRIPVEYEQEDNGSWSCWSDPHCEGLTQTYGCGNTFDEAVNDYVDALKEIAACIYEDEVLDKNTSAEYLTKILICSKEELKQCLDGKISEDI